MFVLGDYWVLVKACCAPKPKVCSRLHSGQKTSGEISKAPLLFWRALLLHMRAAFKATGTVLLWMMKLEKSLTEWFEGGENICIKYAWKFPYCFQVSSSNGFRASIYFWKLCKLIKNPTLNISHLIFDGIIALKVDPIMYVGCTFALLEFWMRIDDTDLVAMVHIGSASLATRAPSAIRFAMAHVNRCDFAGHRFLHKIMRQSRNCRV